MDRLVLEAAKDKFEALIRKQLKRIDEMNAQGEAAAYASLTKIVVGICGGDGIGPAITGQAKRILNVLMKNEIRAGKIEMVDIDDLTLEKRAEEMAAIPASVLEQLKKCHVILKGPTTTPRKGDPYPNVESANVAMRKELDLYANVRPVRVPDRNIDWVFFRENTEGGYAVGKNGMDITEDLGIDFTIVTTPGCERIIEAAFAFAHANAKKRVTAVTKANIIKTTDGKFLDVFYRIAKRYPDITADDWYIDIMTAKLLDEKRRHEFEVFVLPNLYGDILTDEAAEMQGGVGTAGSANIGRHYAMFEAIHGSAPRMVEEGRAIYADPCSIIRASAMLLSHIGYADQAHVLNRALDVCTLLEKKLVITGRSTGATSAEFADYLLETIASMTGSR